MHKVLWEISLGDPGDVSTQIFAYNDAGLSKGWFLISLEQPSHTCPFKVQHISVQSLHNIQAKVLFCFLNIK